MINISRQIGSKREKEKDCEKEGQRKVEARRPREHKMVNGPLLAGDITAGQPIYTRSLARAHALRYVKPLVPRPLFVFAPSLLCRHKMFDHSKSTLKDSRM